MSLTLGQIHNSPLNVKGTDWKGSLGVDPQGHAIFEDLPHGIRAAARTLAAKYANNKRTLRVLCADWAPSDDTLGSLPGQPQNDPLEYANFVANGLETGIDTPLRLFSSNAAITSFDTLVGLIIAFSLYENDHWSPPVSAILHGMGLYQEDFVEAQNR